MSRKGMFRRLTFDAPGPLLLLCALFFLASYFPTRFSDVPGASIGSYVSTVAIALPAAVALWRFLGPRTATVSLLALSLFGYGIETLGVVTGFPYGPFDYGDALGPKLFGLVPYLLPVTWAPLVLGAVGAASRTVPSRVSRLPRTLLHAVSAAVLLTLVDGVLDPGAVSLGFWAFAGGGPYYGVPISNYLGWLLSSTLAALLLLALGRGSWEKAAPPPGILDSALISVSFWTGVALFSGLAFPVLLGAGLFAFLLRRRSRLASANA